MRFYYWYVKKFADVRLIVVLKVVNVLKFSVHKQK